MINSRFFNYLLTLYALTFIGSIILTIADPFNVHNEAAEMAFEKVIVLVSNNNQRSLYIERFDDAFGFMTIFLFTISMIGMFFRKSFSRYTYLFYFIVSLFWTAFFDDDIFYTHRITDSLEWLTSSLEGAVLILVLFLKEKIGFPDRH